MVINLLHETSLNNYLFDLVYQGENIPKQQNYKGEFESPDYVEQHSDEIVKGILYQYIKLRLRKYMIALKDEPAFELVDKNRSDLPGWTEQIFARGENIYEFNGVKISQKLRDEITMVRDFLYDEAAQYVNKVVQVARETKRKPKIRYDYLKTGQAYDTFEKTLAAAEHWHENMAAEIEKRNKARNLLKKSLVDVKHIMDLGDGLSAYQLLSPTALDFESEYMGHCVGKGGYDSGVQNGNIQIYSIRDERGEPHATLEVRYGKIQQCKGKSNKKPIRKYLPAIQRFVLKQEFYPEHDLKNMDFIKIDGKLYGLYNLPKYMRVYNSVNLNNYDLTELPDMSGWTVQGSFFCDGNKLTNLRGAPKSVGSNFSCTHNQLTSLSGAPKSVGASFDCGYNQLTNLDGAPKSVAGNFKCYNNLLTSLDGAPKSVGGNFSCYYNLLTSLDGAPKSVARIFDCSHNRLTNLRGAPESIGCDFDCRDNQLTSLNGAPKTVGGDFSCNNNQLTSLSGTPEKVSGDFDCRDNQLTSLNGAPKSVGASFDCGYNQLTNLDGAPESVGASFDCGYNQLTSLNGAPQTVGHDFKCNNNLLTSLNGAPERVDRDFDCVYNLLTSLNGAPESVGGNFHCRHNQLTSLNGAPEKVGGNFYCRHNQLTNLEGAPEKVGGDFYCDDNQLTNLEGAPEKVGGDFDCSHNRLTSLNGAPKSVGCDFDCRDNQLTSLNGAPKTVGGVFYCDDNQLTSLERAPERVDHNLENESPQDTKTTNKPKTKKSLFYSAIQKIKNKLSEKFNVSDTNDRE